MKYFDWSFDSSRDDVWFLGEPFSKQTRIDSWEFKKCQSFPQESKPLSVPIKQSGVAVDASFGAFDLLYVSPRMGDALRGLAASELQLVPGLVESVDQQIFLVNVLKEMRCIDEEASEFTKWEPGNSGRPDKVGQYRNVWNLRISAALAEGAHIFRPWGWHVALIVSEKLKDVVESIGAEGTVFRPVS